MRGATTLAGLVVAGALSATPALAAPPRTASATASVQVIGGPIKATTAVANIAVPAYTRNNNGSSDAVCTMSPSAKTTICGGAGATPSGTPAFESLTITGALAGQLYNITIGTVPTTPSGWSGATITFNLATSNTADTAISTGLTLTRTVPAGGSDTITLGSVVTLPKSTGPSTATSFHIPVTVAYN